MPIKTVLFDLDGTLLPMDQDQFIKAYFGGLCRRLAPLGYQPDALIKGIWAGTAAMVKNDGQSANETVFWNTFAGLFGDGVRAHMPEFEAFYRENFDDVAAVCGHSPYPRQIVELLHARGVDTVLATNPIFPAIATQKRMRWAGLSPEDFSLYTTYENARFCKPNLDYYRDILSTVNAEPHECLMVGNDVEEDMIASALGMHVFLLTDCLINKHERDISVYPHGDFPALLTFLQKNSIT